MGNQGFDVDETISILRKLKLEFYENEAWGGADYVASYLQHGKKGTEVLAKLTEEQIDWILQNRTSEVVEDIIESTFFKKKNIKPNFQSTNGQSDVIGDQHGLDSLWTKDGDELLVGYTSMKEGETLSKFGIKFEKDGFMELSFTDTAQKMRALTGKPSKYNSTEFFIQAEKVGDISSSIRSRELMEEFVESLDSPPAFDIVIDVDGTPVINRQVFDIGFDDWIKRNHPDDAFDVWMVSSDHGNVSMKIFNQKSLIHRRTTNHKGMKIYNNYDEIPNKQIVQKLPDNISPRKESPFGVTTGGVDVDEFTEKIWGLIGDDGILSSEHAQKIGNEIHKEILNNPKMMSLQKEIEASSKSFKELNDIIIPRDQNLVKRMRDGTIDEDELRKVGKEIRKLKDERSVIRDRRVSLQKQFNDSYADLTIKTLSRVRQTGKSVSNATMRGSGKVKESLRRSTVDLPSDWVDLVDERVRMKLSVEDRGSFSTEADFRYPLKSTEGLQHSNRSNINRTFPDSKLVVSKRKLPRDSHHLKWKDKVEDVADLKMDRTSLHEFVHAVQQSSGRKMQKLEREFLVESFEKGIEKKSYLKIHRDDDGYFQFPEVFEENYVSKIYAYDSVGNKLDLMSVKNDPSGLLDKLEGSAADDYEVMTMGLEGLFHGKYNVRNEPDFRNFVLGMLFGF